MSVEVKGSGSQTHICISVHIIKESGAASLFVSTCLNVNNVSESVKVEQETLALPRPRLALLVRDDGRPVCGFFFLFSFVCFF